MLSALLRWPRASADHGERDLPAAAGRAMHVRPAGLHGRRLRRALRVVRGARHASQCTACSAVASRREESEARLVSGAESVRLRGFSTRVHRVDALVAYKADDGAAA